ncbi:MAG: DNA repair protein RadC [Deltaproteobacteria bacterium]|nr:DNA repair protein RadC [Deltaproteobacteria bacterium]
MKCLLKPPLKDRPREKLKLNGAKFLSDAELLAVLLGSGLKGKSVFRLAEELLPVIDARNGDLGPQDLVGIKGIGAAKSLLICAAMEFSRRRIPSRERKIRAAADVLPLVSYLSDRKQEHFMCISLNGAHEVIACRTVTVGLVNLCQVHPREIFADPLKDRACSVIVAHNHPSGELEPSEEDKALTKRLAEAANVLGVRLLDHIIFSPRGFLSFKERGLM